MSRYIETITVFEFVQANKMIKSDCFAITFKNETGGNVININGSLLQPSESLEITQLTGNIDRTQYNVIFNTGTGANLLTVTKTVPKNQPSEIGL